MARNKEGFLLALILLVALGLRLWDPGCVEFKYDEADASLWALEIAAGRQRPLADGSTSWGFRGPALYLYLLALPALFWKSPVAMVVFAALLNVLAVLGTYLFTRRFFAAKAALVAAFLYALNPWAVLFGRKIWVHILPLLSVLLLYAACELVVKRRYWALSLFFLFLGLQSQMHVVAVLAGPAVLVMLTSFRGRLRLGPLLLGLTLFFLSFIPYGIYLSRHGSEVLAAVRGKLGGGTSWGFDMSALRFSLWMASGANLQTLLASAATTFSGYARLLSWLQFPAGLSLAAGLSWAAYICLRRREGYQAYLIVMAWMVGPVLPLIWRFIPALLHYLVILYPAPFVIMALPFGWALSASRRWVAGAALVVLIVMGGVQIAGLVALHERVQSYETWGGFGAPLKYWQRLAELAKAEARARSLQEVYAITEGVEAHYAEAPAIIAALLEPEFHPRFVGRKEGHYLLVPPVERDAVYIVPPGAVPRLYRRLERFGREAGRVVLPGGAQEGRVYVLRAFPPPEVESLAQWRSSAQFDNGARLLGYDLPGEAQPGQEVWLVLYWSFRGLKERIAERQYVVFSHFVDGGGRKWAQLDAFGWPTYRWREGETVVAWYPLQLPKDIPPGKYMVVVGMYDWRDGKRSPLVDEAGHLLGDALELGPIMVGPEPPAQPQTSRPGD